MARIESNPQEFLDSESQEYKEIFLGEAFISGGQDTGSFLARNSGADERKAWDEFFKNEVEWDESGQQGPEPEPPQHRLLLDMAGSFPGKLGRNKS